MDIFKIAFCGLKRDCYVSYCLLSLCVAHASLLTKVGYVVYELCWTYATSHFCTSNKLIIIIKISKLFLRVRWLEKVTNYRSDSSESDPTNLGPTFIRLATIHGGGNMCGLTQHHTNVNICLSIHTPSQCLYLNHSEHMNSFVPAIPNFSPKYARPFAASNNSCLLLRSPEGKIHFRTMVYWNKCSVSNRSAFIQAHQYLLSIDILDL
jgi:hypothetical protein